MGKHKHSKDRLYMTVTDRKMNYGIARNNQEVVVKTKLPFDVCAISKREIVSPACCQSGEFQVDVFTL